MIYEKKYFLNYLFKKKNIRVILCVCVCAAQNNKQN